MLTLFAILNLIISVVTWDSLLLNNNISWVHYDWNDVIWDVRDFIHKLDAVYEQNVGSNG